MIKPKLHIHLVEAGKGDCVHLCWKEEFFQKSKNVIIDGGTKLSYTLGLKKIAKEIEKKGEKIDLLIVTHYDRDHIEGVIELFKDPEIDHLKLVTKTWFNARHLVYNDKPIYQIERILESFDELSSKKLGPTESRRLTDQLLKAEGHIEWHENYIVTENNPAPIAFGKLSIQILSPNKGNLTPIFPDTKRATTANEEDFDYNQTLEELASTKPSKDYKKLHQSAFAFEISFNNKKFLYFSDNSIRAIEDIIQEFNIQDKKYDAIKLSHHGSKKNMNDEIAKSLKSNLFLISTNGSGSAHPNKECLARIISNRESLSKTKFVLNSNHAENIFTKAEKRKYKIKVDVKGKVKL